MKTKLLNYKVLLFLSLCLFLNCNRYGQEPLENQTKVDTLYWGPAYWETVSQEEECFDSWRDVPGFLYDEPIIKPDSVMECRFTKSELKEIPMVVYTNNLLKHSSPYKTIAKLELNVVDVLIGGTGSNRTFYESHEILWVRDSNCVIDTNANTIRITFDISKKIFYDEDMKFAISFLDSNGKVLFASNETWRNAPLVSSYQSEYGNIIGRCRLLSWNFKKANHSEIKIMTDWDSDLDKDTLVNDYSINLVKNTLHSPLFDHVASVRLDILPPTDKYDRILNEIIQNKIKRMYNEMNNYRKSDKVDCDFVRDFLLAPNCLNDIFLCPGDIEACINYYFAGGLNNDLAYFCYRTICWIYENELVTYIFNRTGGDSLGLSSKQGYTSALSKLLNDFVFDNNRLLINTRILSKAFPYEEVLTSGGNVIMILFIASNMNILPSRSHLLLTHFFPLHKLYPLTSNAGGLLNSYVRGQS